MPPKVTGGVTPQSNKRKQPPAGTTQASKKFRLNPDPRNVKTQSTSNTIKNGELDISKFVQAREYEIQAIESSMRLAGKMRNSRAFQQVPRDLRRRTASHNAKKVPKRLRNRAKKEMVMDNTPTVQRRRREPSTHLRKRLTAASSLKVLAEKAKKRANERKLSSMELAVTADEPTSMKKRAPRVKKNVLKTPDIPKARFRKRQRDKTWLPTHLHYAKRAHMTSPKNPLWGFAIPLTANLKGYRPTHHASNVRGAIAWDTSYISTIGLEGAEKSLEGLLQALGVGSGDTLASTWGQQGHKWRQGTRVWHGWLYEREKYPEHAIAPATIIWCCQKKAQSQTHREESVSAKKLRRKILVRVHPSAFKHLWKEVVRIAKIQKPVVDVEDLRFELGSIEIAGPQATEALVGVLYPVVSTPTTTDPCLTATISAIWKQLGGVTNPAILPSNVLMACDMADPRLWFPPRRVQLPIDNDSKAQMDLLRICSEWPLDGDQPPQSLFDRNARLIAQRSMRSQKSVNRRKAAAGIGKYPKYETNDPRIPAMLFTGARTLSSQSSWTVVLPWKCIRAVWRSLMYYPLSTGGQVRLGCLKEQRQLAFEAGMPWFPGDFPGTKAGDDWEELERLRREAEWQGKPKGKRIAWESVQLSLEAKGEVGRGWACDWQFLFQEMISELRFPNFIPRGVAQNELSKRSGKKVSGAADGIITVKITLLSKGVPETCARIYRLPSDNEALRDVWLSLQFQQGSRRQCQKLPIRLPDDAPQHVRSEHLAQSLLSPIAAQPGKADYPSVPGECDLIGFVTTGNFNLGEGKGLAIGAVRLSKALSPVNRSGLSEMNRMCIVRNSGQKVGRLARWELA